MIIHNGEDRKTNRWTKEEISFEELTQRLKKPKRIPFTYDEFISLSKDNQNAFKDAGGYIGADLQDGIRKNETVINRSLIALDADHIPNENALDELLERLRNTKYNYCWHTTAKHTPEQPRVRIIIPFDGPIDPEKYEPVVRGLCYELGMDMFDYTCDQISRFMFYPACCKDVNFRIERRLDRENLNADEYLEQTYTDWRDSTQWKQFSSENETPIRTTSFESDNPLKRLGDPKKKNGYIGMFCRAYAVSEAIDTFLSDKYEPGDEPNRYTYIPGSSSNGLKIYDDDLYAYSYHETDPAGNGHCQNAYDIVRIGLFGDTEESMDEMNKFLESLSSDSKFKQQRVLEAQEAFTADRVEFTDKDKDNITDLLSELECTKKGRYKATSANFYKILTQDPALAGKFYFDIFSNRKIIAKPLPWINPQETLPRMWEDSDDAGLRMYIEEHYQGIRSSAMLSDAVEKAFRENMVHPVREYLDSLEWDQIPRVRRLLIDYFGAEDNVYTREAIEKTLLAAVTRVYKPGTKFDNVLILKGQQGTGKSTFVRMLASDEWFSDSLTRFDGKDASELLENKWIIELGELKGLYRKEIEQAKQFFSKTSDQYRAAYARHPKEHPRQCVFIGTTNNETFLTDRTGNRRFWPIELGVNEPTKSVFTDLATERDQIWAEVKHLYDLLKGFDERNNEMLVLSDEARKLAEIEQENRLEDDPRRGDIIDFILREVPEDWESRDLNERMWYWQGNYDFYEPKAMSRREDKTPTKRRDRICALEIIKELYKENGSKKGLSNEINNLLQSITGLKKTKSTLRYGKAYRSQRGFLVEDEFYQEYGDNDQN